MDDSGETRDDIKLPEGEVGAELQAKFDAGDDVMATVLGACGEEMIIAAKPMEVVPPAGSEQRLSA